MDSFNKVIIGSGLMAEMVLSSLIWHKGESPEEFCIVGEKIQRSVQIMKKYNIPFVANLAEFVSSAKVIVLAFDLEDFDSIPTTIEEIKPIVPRSALINSFTPKLTIRDIEEHFPENPVMRLGINLSAINGMGTGVFCCGSKNKESTETVARFLIESFGDLVEVQNEDEMEQTWDMIQAVTSSCYLAMNCFFSSGVNFGIIPAQAKEIVVSVFRGASETMGNAKHEDLVFRSFKYEKIFKNSLNLLKSIGVHEDMHKIMSGDFNNMDIHGILDTKIDMQK